MRFKIERIKKGLSRKAEGWEPCEVLATYQTHDWQGASGRQIASLSKRIGFELDK
ncbi:MAG: hypothetical protein MUE81_23665 [Thermoflexibacter sp.]|nr:hypothetical protein [Thermoflexibacter sp.]